MNKAITDRAAFSYIRYANCWEDADILVQAQAGEAGQKCLSIAAAGDNSLALLVNDPELVVAVDVSQAQLAALELKMAVFANLDYRDTLAFLGFNSSDNRIAVYNKLKPKISAAATAFWQQNLVSIETGIIFHGKFERYFKMFRNYILPLIHSKTRIKQLLVQKDLRERQEFYQHHWDSWRWRSLFKIFFSRFVMGRAGRDPEFFRYVEGGVAEHIMQRTRHALTDLATHDNPFLTFILTGNFGENLPFYMRPENYSRIQKNLNRLQLFYGDIDQAFKQYQMKFDFFNLSDIFEYMDPVIFAAAANNIVQHAASCAHIAYWNMLVPRSIASILPQQVQQLKELSDNLAQKDKAFFYRDFFVDEVIA
ncbi:MAG: DUF3419 family protein [Gammaproteobacteria bacterium]|nr:DUF3419 family protein [Gammaproteobacteria bacterium]